LTIAVIIPSGYRSDRRYLDAISGQQEQIKDAIVRLRAQITAEIEGFVKGL